MTIHKFVLLSLCIFIALYSDAQKKWQWARSGNNLGNATSNGLAIDKSGNLYTIGSFENTLLFDPVSLSSTGSKDVFLVKYSKTGNVLWARKLGGAGNDEGIGIAIDNSDHILITGNFENKIYSDNDSIVSAGSTDIFLAKYSPSGSMIWLKRAGGAHPDHISFNFGGIAVDNQNNVFITGDYGNDGASPPTHWSATFDTVVLTSKGGPDAFLAQYDSNGNVNWAKSMGGVNGDYGFDLAADHKGNVYVTGNFNNPWIDFDTLRVFSASTGSVNSNVFIARYSGNGDRQWVKTISGSGAGDIYATHLCADATGNVYVSGTFFDCTLRFSANTSLGSKGGDDLFVSNYDSSGNLLWAKSAGWVGYDLNHDIAIDKDNNVYVTGSFNQFTVFGKDTLQANGSPDIFVGKYDKNGHEQWIMRAGGEGREEGTALCTDADNNVYVSGYFNSISCEFGLNTLNSGGDNDVFIAKLLPNSTDVPTFPGNNPGKALLYPNPSTGICALSFEPGIYNKVIVTDISGHVVRITPLDKKINSCKLDLGTLANGSYQITLDGTATTTCKLLLQH